MPHSWGYWLYSPQIMGISQKLMKQKSDLMTYVRCACNKSWKNLQKFPLIWTKQKSDLQVCPNLMSVSCICGSSTVCSSKLRNSQGIDAISIVSLNQWEISFWLSEKTEARAYCYLEKNTLSCNLWSLCWT